MNAARLIDILANQTFFEGMNAEHLALIADCAELRDFAAGSTLLRQGEPANAFHVLLEGRVSLALRAGGRSRLVIETLLAPAVVGWSWLLPPYRWHFDVQAMTDTHTVEVHTPCILGKIEQDKVFGYEIYRRFLPVVVERLQAARLQMLDVYAKPDEHSP